MSHPTSTPALSDSQVVGVVYSTVCILKTERKRLGETHVWKTQRDAVRSITNIYSLVELNCLFQNDQGKTASTAKILSPID